MPIEPSDVLISEYIENGDFPVGICRNCRWFSIGNGDLDVEEFGDNAVGISGKCNRMPPAFHVPLNGGFYKERSKDISWMLGYTPQVSSDDWCGEFAHITTEQQELRDRVILEYAAAQLNRP